MCAGTAGKKGTPKSIADVNIQWIYFQKLKLKSSSRTIWWMQRLTPFCKARQPEKSAMEKYLSTRLTRRFGSGIRSVEFPRFSSGRNSNPLHAIMNWKPRAFVYSTAMAKQGGGLLDRI